MGRPHWEPQALVVAMVSHAATHSVAAKGLLLAPVRVALVRARRAEMLLAVLVPSSAELAAFVQACHTQPPGQMPTLMKLWTDL